MPATNYIKAAIDNQELELGPDGVNISISYKLEDPANFQSKKSSEALSVITPATINNDKIANTFHNPGIDDNSPEERYRNFRPAVIEANGHELLVGKALLTYARHASSPVNYEFDFFANNADWLIDLNESTLFDFVNPINFTFTKANIIASWAFDGRDENLPYVFAPVRYGRQLETFPQNFVEANPPVFLDYNMPVNYMKPALSVYWLLFWGFKSLGYRISSTFFDTDYFRRMVMPWTWGNFLVSDGTRLNNLNFLAMSTVEGNLLNVSYTGYLDAHVDNDSASGAYDNNGSYEYDDADKEMKWTYLNTFDYGILEATFRFNIFIDAKATANSDVELYLRWYKNGVQVDGDEIVVYLNAPAIGSREFLGNVETFKTFSVQPNDIISAKLFADNFDSDLGRARLHAKVEAFTIDYFSIPVGGTIDFQNYAAFKKYKFLDLLAGIVDTFNISPQTDPINKVVYLEPTHPYSLTNDLSTASGGYFNGNFLDWEAKQDISKVSTLPLFSDSERELLFNFKDDSADGLLKKVQDRNSILLGQGKYAFSDRFKQGTKKIENRFFSPVMHAELTQWKGFGSDPDASPQLVCLVPENVSNTSKDEAQNTFTPKLCYYKGVADNVGWKFDGLTEDSYPFMFAVNYQEGGESDPVLSYCD
ncbi:MAG TPA: hypothetical protein VK644_10505, partial [Chitinophagaceae bacterium]|nr:hypothetical protein [Chitinophagaceae bacterium]